MEYWNIGLQASSLPYRSMFDVRCSMFGVQCSRLDVGCSMSNGQWSRSADSLFRVTASELADMAVLAVRAPGFSVRMRDAEIASVEATHQPQSRAGVPPASVSTRKWNFTRADTLARQAGRLPYFGRAVWFMVPMHASIQTTCSRSDPGSEPIHSIPFRPGSAPGRGLAVPWPPPPDKASQ